MSPEPPQDIEVSSELVKFQVWVNYSFKTWIVCYKKKEKEGF